MGFKSSLNGGESSLSTSTRMFEIENFSEQMIYFISLLGHPFKQVPRLEGIKQARLRGFHRSKTFERTNYQKGVHETNL